MGTSIHMFIEYDDNSSSIPFSVIDNVYALSFAELRMPDKYDLFNALAGGRSHTTGDVNKPPMFRPRGLPTPVSYVVYYRYYHVIDDPNYTDKKYDQLPSWVVPLPFVSESTAKEWIEKGWSALAPIENHRLGRPRRRRISGPNWHSASWLSVSEIGSSLAFHGISEVSVPVEMLAYLSAMRNLEENVGPNRTRLVFWFDN